MLATLFAIIAIGAESPAPAPESYDFEVSLLTPSNKDFTMLTTIQVNQPFEMEATNGRVRNKVSGTLQSPKEGKYLIDIMVYEWESEMSQMKNTSKFELELGKASGDRLEISSFVYIRHFTLRRYESRIEASPILH
jgi:hypothetical protein